MTDDRDLLAAYAQTRDPAAFAALVRRHADLVYNACLRQARGDRHLADDATQATFLLLAQRAGRLSPSVVLAGWLYTTARHAAANACRAETRRRRHERKAAQAMPTTTPPADAVDDAAWAVVSPLLDAAVHALPARDRDALLLRYFQGQSVRDVAAALGVSEDAAKQRLSRAVDKLRSSFAARGLATPAAALTATLLASANAQAAPPALISAACTFALPATAAPASVSLIAGKTLLMTQLKSLAALVAVTTPLVVAATGAALLLAAPPAPPTSPASPATRAASTTAPATAPAGPTAASLVRELRAAEAWIDTVRSIHLTAELTWLPPDGAAPAAAGRPAGEVVKLALGFDDRRLFFREDATDYLLLNRRTWDGKLAVIHEKYDADHGNQERYTLQDTPWFVGELFMNALSWVRVGPHKYWWVQPGRQTPEDLYGGSPEDFRVARRETFRGVDCYVLESDLYYRTLHVGVSDHRLYGLTNAVLPRRSMAARDAARLQVARDMGARVTTGAEFDGWFKSLSAADRRRYTIERFKRLRALARPQATHWYGDYKEVAPGRWMPMHQGYDLWSDPEQAGAPYVTRSRDIRITAVTVDRPLPDEALAWNFAEGVDVFDQRTPGTLQYTYKRHFEPAEWEQIVADAADRAFRRRPGSEDMTVQLTRTRALGKPAPEFPAGAAWINSKPLKTADLAGKVVIVQFFASGSKSARDDVARLNDLHARRDRPDGVTVIAIHPAGTPVEDVRKWVQENGVTYPVCVDTPAGPGPWDGTLFDAYRVLNLPNAYVIDPKGTVRSEGKLAGAIDVARKSRPPVPDGL